MSPSVVNLQVADKLGLPPNERPEAILCCQWMKMRIERMAPNRPPMWSQSALTGLNEQHREFHAKAEDCGDAADKLLIAVRLYADEVPEPRLLIWRINPECDFRPNDGKWNVYARMNFTTDTRP